MKTLVGACFSLIFLSSVFGQGTVTFLNDSVTLTSPPDRLVRFRFASTPGNVFGIDNAPAVGTNWQIQLYYGASTAAESALVSVTSAPARLRAATTALPGRWSGGGTRTLNNFPYGSGYVKLQVRAWDINFGNTYEAASASGFTGTSSAFLYLMPTSAGDPATNFAMANFTGLYLGDFDDYQFPPVIATGTPQSQSVASGQTAIFSVSATSYSPLSYFWRFYGTNLPGATANPLIISNVQQSNTGPYSVVVINPYGAATSSVATLSISNYQAPPVIAPGTPSDQSVTLGQISTLAVSVTGDAPLSYFWRFYGTNLPGATTNPLVISNVQLSNLGPYSVVVTNLYGTATSSVATLSSVDATVWFQNDSTSLPAPPDRLVRFSTASTPGNVAGVDNAPAVGTNFLVQLYYGPASADEGALIPVTSAPARLRPSSTSTPGIWASGGTRTLTGFPFGSGSVTLQVRVWDTADGQTYEQAIAKQPPGVSGKSQTFLYGIPSAADAPPPNFLMNNFQGFFIASGNPQPPTIPIIFSVSPQSQSVALGQSATFSSAVIGAAPLIYHWRLNGTDIPGATSNPWSIPSVQSADQGQYSLAVTNSYGFAISSNVSLTVRIPPSIALQPTNLAVFAGQTATFTVSATGSQPLLYQWQLQGANISGATQSSYSLANAQPLSSGDYRVVISNSVGFAVSSNATLVVLSPPIITSHPTNLNVGPGATAIFRVGAIGQGLSYQWRFNGADLSTATGSTLTLPNVQSANVGVYSAVVSNAYGVAFTSNAILALMDPFIAVQPGGQAVGLGGQASLSVVMQGTAPFSYQWRHNGNIIPGATSSTLALSNIQVSDFGRYSVVINNPVGSVTSQDALVSFNGPSGVVVFVNDPVSLPSPPDRLVRFTSQSTPGNVFGTNNAAAVGTNLMVQLYYGPAAAAENQLVPVASAPARLRPTTTTIPGVWSGGGSRTLEGLPLSSGQATLQVRAWNGADGASYEQALLNNSLGVSGKSGLFVYNMPASFADPPINFLMSTFQGFTLDQPSPPAGLPTTVFSLSAFTRGGGSLDLAPAGGGFYASNTTVTVTATPDQGWTFLGWCGDAPDGNPIQQVLMNQDKTLEAVFGTALNTLTSGNGSIALSPAASIYPFGTTVRLSSIPAAGNYFAGWGNDAEGDSNPLYFPITEANPTVSGFFTPLTPGQAALALNASGNGTVTVDPAANSYALGTILTLTATPDGRQTFVGWSGDASGSQNPLQLTLNQSMSVTATFSSKPSLNEAYITSKTGFHFTLNGDLGARYRIEISTNGTSWDLLKVITNLTGSTQLDDQTIANSRARLYRAVLAP